MGWTKIELNQAEIFHDSCKMSVKIVEIGHCSWLGSVGGFYTGSLEFQLLVRPQYALQASYSCFASTFNTFQFPKSHFLKIQVQHEETGDEILPTAYKLGPIFCISKPQLESFYAYRLKLLALDYRPLDFILVLSFQPQCCCCCSIWTFLVDRVTLELYCQF